MNRQRVQNLFSLISWRPQLDSQTLRSDFIAGMTGAIVILPQGVAFATIAGMPPQYGLYAGMIPAIIAAVFGSSHHLVSGPSTATSLVLFAVLSSLAEPATESYIRLALTLTFMVGVTELVMGIARLGFLITFISHSVEIGFTAGAAILIASNELNHFFGVSIPHGLQFYETLLYFAQHLHEIHLFVALLGVTTLAVGIGVRHYLPQLPYMLIALIAGSVAAGVLNYEFGQATTGIRTVGALPPTFPPFSTPDFSLATFQELAPAALAVSLFALTTSVSIARSLAVRSGQIIKGNREFISQGLSNIVGCFFSAYVATGSINRSALNYEAGAKTPMAAVFAGALLIPVVIFVAPLANYLPNAVMAGILFLVAWGLIDFSHIRRTLRASRADSSVLLGTFLATLLLKLEFAILLGILLSFVVYLSRTSRPSVRVRVPDPASPDRLFTSDTALPECPQLKIVRIDGSLFFGAVDFVRERLRSLAKEYPQQKHLLILARSINFVDVAGAELLAEEARRRRVMGGRLYLHQVKESTCETLKRGGYQEDIGAENVFDSKRQAIATIFERLDREICTRCDKRIFRECASVPHAALSKAPAKVSSSNLHDGS